MAQSSLFPTTIHVEGLRELNRDLGKLSKKIQRQLQAEIRKLAEPAAELIRREAQSHHFSEKTISGIRAGSSMGQAVVRQRRGKKTGARADFGSIQFRLAFLPGAKEAEPLILVGVEHWLEEAHRENGLGLRGGLL